MIPILFSVYLNTGVALVRGGTLRGIYHIQSRCAALAVGSELAALEAFRDGPVFVDCQRLCRRDVAIDHHDVVHLALEQVIIYRVMTWRVCILLLQSLFLYFYSKIGFLASRVVSHLSIWY